MVKKRLKSFPVIITSAFVLTTLGFLGNYLLTSNPNPKSKLVDRSVQIQKSVDTSLDLIFLPPVGESNIYGCFQLADLNHDGEPDSLIKRLSTNYHDNNGCEVYNNTNIEATMLITSLDKIDYKANENSGLKNFKYGANPIKIEPDIINSFKKSVGNRVRTQKRLEDALYKAKNKQ